MKQMLLNFEQSCDLISIYKKGVSGKIFYLHLYVVLSIVLTANKTLQNMRIPS